MKWHEFVGLRVQINTQRFALLRVASVRVVVLAGGEFASSNLRAGSSRRQTCGRGVRVDCGRPLRAASAGGSRRLRAETLVSI
jgi:hypothetical protein